MIASSDETSVGFAGGGAGDGVCARAGAASHTNINARPINRIDISGGDDTGAPLF
jgi:hypothetical protein